MDIFLHVHKVAYRCVMQCSMYISHAGTKGCSDYQIKTSVGTLNNHIGNPAFKVAAVIIIVALMNSLSVTPRKTVFVDHP